jgi:hypothetical protein
MNRFTLGLLVFLAASFSGPAAKANVTYTYTGNDFTTVVGSLSETTSDFITASFTFASPLLDVNPDSATPLSWTMSDGVESLSSADYYGSVGFDFETDASGNLLNWYFSAWGQGPCVVSGGICTNPSFSIDNGNAGLGNDLVADSVGYFAFGGSTPAWYAENSNDRGTWTQTAGSAAPEPSTFLLLSAGLGISSAFRLAKRTLRQGVR